MVNGTYKHLNGYLALVLHRARRQKNLTRKALAIRAGYSVAVVDSIEQGHGNPRLDTLTDVAHVLGLAPSQLLRQAEELAKIDEDSENGTYDLSGNPVVVPDEKKNPVARFLSRYYGVGEDTKILS